MIVILHNIRSVFNVASIFRTADGVGVEKIYLTGITPGPLDKFGKMRGYFTKVSLGSEKSIEWEQVSSTVKLLKRLKNEGCEIWAVEQHAKSVPYHSVGLLRSGGSKTCLVMGSEVNGLPQSVLSIADKI